MRVTVVIPCYNAQRYLGQTIRSVLQQTCPPDELLVVDDGSTDDSLAVARSFGSSVRILREDHGGAARARNIGGNASTGEAIMFLDADDVLGPTVLEALTRSLERNSSGVAVGPWCRMEREGGRWVQKPPTCRSRRRGEDPLAAWLTGWYHNPCSVLWSRRALDLAGWWDEQVTVNDDGDLMMRSLALGVPLTICGDGMSFYRRVAADEGSLSARRFKRDGVRSQLYVLKKIGRLLAEREDLSRYRLPLGIALQNVADHCGNNFPDLRREIDDLIVQYGASALRIWLARRKNGIGAALRRMARIAHPPGRALKRTTPQVPTVEIRYGEDADAG